MKLQFKIIIIFSISTGIFIMSVIGLQYINLKQKSIFIQNSQKNKQIIIDLAFKYKSDQMIMMNKDNSAWDNLVDFCNNKLTNKWAEDNIATIIDQFKINYIWIFNKNQKIIFTRIDTLANTPTVSLSADFVQQSFKGKPFCNFYHIADGKVIEIAGSIIVPSSDNKARKTSPQGYFICGRVLNNNFIKEMQEATDYKVNLYIKNKKDSTFINNQENSFISIRSLNDMNGKNIAAIEFVGKNLMKGEIEKFYKLAFIISIFSLLSIVLFFIILNYIFNKPLKKISQALTNEDLKSIQDLKYRTDEFGQIALLIENFFEQSADLKELNAILSQQRDEMFDQADSLAEANNVLNERNEEIKSQHEEIQKQSEKIKDAHDALTKLTLHLKHQTYSLDETASVAITDTNGTITYVNDKFLENTGLTREYIIGKNTRLFKSGIHSKEFYDDLWETISIKKTKWRGEICNKYVGDNFHWYDMTIIPFLDVNNNPYQYLAIRFDITDKKVTEHEQKKEKDIIENANKEMTASIEYALHIQKAMMPSDALLEQLLPRFFTYFKPRDIVSGDFYWANRDKNNVFLAVADCTGHGVPGAFMSILGISLLDKIIKEKEIYEPSLILNELRREIKKLLHQTGTESDQKDGMDISVCVIDLLTMKMKYSGANNNIYLIRKAGNELILTNKVAANKIKTSNYGNLDFIDFKSDRMPIGIYYNEKDSFTQIEFQIEKRDAIYLLTDGYADQFGGEHDQKFYFRNLKDLLIKVQDKSLLEQKRILDETIVKWQGNFPQTDDILVVGIKF